jgi:tetratricopeptide (TPR) repeat protein
LVFTRANRALSALLVAAFAAQVGGCASTPADASPQNGKQASTPTAPSDEQAIAALVKRGDAAWQAGELDRAVYFYVSSMQQTAPVAATLAKIGAIEESRNNGALAEKAFEMARAADPLDLRIAERLGNLYLQNDKIDAAGLVFAAVMAVDPQRARTLAGMGQVHLARADYAQAVRFFDRALAAKDADMAAVLTHRGCAMLRMNDLVRAESDLRAALALSRRRDTVRYLGELQLRRGDNAAAFESLVTVMDAAHAYNEIGTLLLRKKEYRDAREYFSKALTASPTWYEEADKNLALANEKLRGDQN